MSRIKIDSVKNMKLFKNTDTPFEYKKEHAKRMCLHQISEMEDNKVPTILSNLKQKHYKDNVVVILHIHKMQFNLNKSCKYLNGFCTYENKDKTIKLQYEKGKWLLHYREKIYQAQSNTIGLDVTDQIFDHDIYTNVYRFTSLNFTSDDVDIKYKQACDDYEPYQNMVRHSTIKEAKEMRVKLVSAMTKRIEQFDLQNFFKENNFVEKYRDPFTCATNNPRKMHRLIHRIQKENVFSYAVYFSMFNGIVNSLSDFFKNHIGELDSSSSVDAFVTKIHDHTKTVFNKDILSMDEEDDAYDISEYFFSSIIENNTQIKQLLTTYEENVKQFESMLDQNTLDTIDRNEKKLIDMIDFGHSQAESYIKNILSSSEINMSNEDKKQCIEIIVEAVALYQSFKIKTEEENTILYRPPKISDKITKAIKQQMFLRLKKEANYNAGLKLIFKTMQNSKIVQRYKQGFLKSSLLRILVDCYEEDKLQIEIDMENMKDYEEKGGLKSLFEQYDVEQKQKEVEEFLNKNQTFIDDYLKKTKRKRTEETTTANTLTARSKKK